MAINVNTVEEDLLPQMKERAATKHFPYPYLFDESQKIGKAYGALFTPEFFVLDKDRKVAYMGAFDDNVEPTKIKHAYLEPAVEARAQGSESQSGGDAGEWLFDSLCPQPTQKTGQLTVGVTPSASCRLRPAALRSGRAWRGRPRRRGGRPIPGVSARRCRSS